MGIPFTANGQPSQVSPPKLILGLVIDGLTENWIQQNWDLLGEGGFKKILRNGVQYTQAEIPHMLSGSAPSLATLSTGTLPATHGIIADQWYNRLRREEIHPTENYLLQSIGSDGMPGKHGPEKLLATTFGDQLILRTNGKSRVVSLAIQPQNSILMGGHGRMGCYWYDKRSGQWITSSAYQQELPVWLQEFNSKKSSDLYIGQDWNLILSESMYQSCMPDANPFETGYTGGFKTFPYKMNRIRRESMDRDYGVLTQSPFGNTMLVDLALAAVNGERLGEDHYPDLMMISFSSVYQIARLFGSDSREVLDAMLRLDMDIQHLLYQTEETVGRNQLLVILTSTHGMVRDPDYAKYLGLPNGYFRYRNAMALLNSYLSAIFGEGVWIENYFRQQIYLNEAQLEKSDKPYHEVIESAARFLTKFEGVAFASPVDRLSNGLTPEPWSQLVHNSYHPDRSGDIILILQPGWMEDSGFDTDCLSPYPYDSRIPLIWYGWGLQSARINRKVNLRDVAPTLSYITGIPAPDAASGELMREVVK